MCVAGEITVVSALDREDIPSYELLVMATDGSLTSTASVAVLITDVNDEPPRFTHAWWVLWNFYDGMIFV